MRQWMPRTTAYAERLLNDLAELDYRVYQGCNATGFRWQIHWCQCNWSERLTRNSPSLPTRPITGDPSQSCPEHDLLDAITSSEQADAVADYKHQASLSLTSRCTTLLRKQGWTGAMLSTLSMVRKFHLIADYVLCEL